MTPYRWQCFLKAAATVIFGQFWSIFLQKAHATYIAQAELRAGPQFWKTSWLPAMIKPRCNRQGITVPNWGQALNSGKMAPPLKVTVYFGAENTLKMAEIPPPPNRVNWNSCHAVVLKTWRCFPFSVDSNLNFVSLQGKSTHPTLSKCVCFKVEEERIAMGWKGPS